MSNEACCDIGLDMSIRKIVKAGVASEVHYKEEYLNSDTLAGKFAYKRIWA